MIRLQVLLALFGFSLSAYSQSYHPAPLVHDPPLFNTQLRHTASLLNQERPQVRILIYGQSISVQDWWKELKTYFEEKYPNATFSFTNKAIGGFSSERLVLTAENDIVPVYPDLIVFHDYGNEEDYEKIIRIIRSKTTADVAIQTDHLAEQDQVWHDKHSNSWIPSLCEKYGLGLLDVRKYWKRYLAQNSLKAEDLLEDGVHLNDHGNYLMAGIMKAYFDNLHYDGKQDGRVTKLQRGKDFVVANGSIIVPIKGNRVDVSSDTMEKAARLEVLVDGASLNAGKACHYYTRPLVKSTGGYITNIGSLIALELSDHVVEEDFFLTILSVDSVQQKISFSVSGSKTGHDGGGSSSSPFTSKSGRISIQPEHWFIRRHDGDFAQHAWLKPGDVLQWQIKSMCSTSLVLPASSTQTLLQGIENTDHELKLTGAGVEHIDEIIVYSPLPEKNH